MEVRIHGSACLLWAFLLLCVPLRWLLSSLAAACFHELCHYAALRLIGGKILSLQIQANGTTMEIVPLPSEKELICALAGPMGSMLLLLLIQVFPRVALCAGLQGIFNLLPLYPLDGGRAIRCGLKLIKEKFLAKQRISEYNSATK